MNAVVEALAEYLARQRNITRARAHQLPDLMSSRDCPEQFLPGLGSVVGLTFDLRLTGHLTDAEAWRRAIDAAPRMWGERGGLEILRDAVHAFAAARLSVFGWRQLVTLFAYPSPGWPWIMTYPISVHGDYYTEAHVEDVDGLLDLDLVVDTIDALRASGEVVRLVETRYVESWENLSRWAATFATLEDYYVRLSNLGFVRETYAFERGLSSSGLTRWDDVAYRVIAHIFAGARLDLRVRDDNGGNFYELRVQQGGSNNVALYKSAGLLAQTTVAVPQGDLSTDPRLFQTFVELETASLADGSVDLIAVIDGAPVLTANDPAPLAPADVRIEAIGGVVELDYFEVVPASPTIRTIPE